MAFHQEIDGSNGFCHYNEDLIISRIHSITISLYIKTQKVVLFGFKTRSPTLFEENMNYKSYNKVPRNMFQPKRDEISK